MSKPLTLALYCRLRAVAYTAVQQMRICDSLGGASDRDQLLMTSWSSPIVIIIESWDFLVVIAMLHSTH